MNWDWIVSFAIIGGLILAAWAKVSGMTIPELLREIRDFFKESSEEATEVIAYYE